MEFLLDFNLARSILFLSLSIYGVNCCDTQCLSDSVYFTFTVAFNLGKVLNNYK